MGINGLATGANRKVALMLAAALTVALAISLGTVAESSAGGPEAVAAKKKKCKKKGKKSAVDREEVQEEDGDAGPERSHSGPAGPQAAGCGLRSTGRRPPISTCTRGPVDCTMAWNEVFVANEAQISNTTGTSRPREAVSGS